MNFTLESLKKSYKEHNKMKNNHLNRECPDPKIFLNFFRQRLSRKHKIKVIDHVSECYFCSREFEFISEIVRAEKTFLEEISFTLYLNHIKKRIKFLNIISSISKKSKALLFYNHAWKYFLVTVLLFSISIYSIKSFNNAKKSEFRGINQDKIILKYPIENKVRKSSINFKWEVNWVPVYYKIEIFDRSLLLIWESKRIYDVSTTLPATILNKMKKNNTYFWMVTAYYQNGSILESPLGQFTFVK
jgi:hypothetical protein